MDQNDPNSAFGGRGRRNGRGREGFIPISAKELFDKQPPVSPEAEMSLLGSMILDPNVVPDVLGLIKSENDFYAQKNAHIYKAVVDVYDQRHSGDLVQILDLLRDRGVLDQVGGAAYLAELAEAVPTAVNAPHFARIVADKAKLRRLIDAAGQILYDAYHAADLGPEGSREVLDSAEMRVFEIAQEQHGSDPTGLAELLDIELKRIEQMDFEGGALSGVASGFAEMDEMLRGLQPGEMLILAARPSMGKCLTADSEIVCRDGSVTTIEELCRRRSGEIPTLTERMKLGWATPSAFIDDGLKPAFEVTTRLGRRIRTTITHPFLTVEGWRPLGELGVGARVAVPRVLHVQGDREMPEHRVKLLAYLIGDGGLTGTSPRFTNSNPRVAADFAGAVEAFGGMTTRLSSTREWEAPSWRLVRDEAVSGAARQAFADALRREMRRQNLTQRAVAQAVGVSGATLTHWVQAATVPDEAAFARLCMVLDVRPDSLSHDLSAARHNAPSALTSWLGELGLMGKGSHEKCVPGPVFTLPRAQLALFLNRLFATDGWATVLASGQSQLGYASVNERLARQVQHLLLRFGIVASLRQRWVKYRDARRSSWQLDITDSGSIRAFIEEVGIFGKEEALGRVSEALSKRRHQTNRDLVPVEVWRRIERAKGTMSWSGLAKLIGASTNLHVGKRGLSRGRLARIAGALHDPGLAQLAASDVYWDEIVSIEALGLRQVYDLTIPGTHNFVANDICVHNTALALNLCEQIARGGVCPPIPAKGRVPVGLFSLEMSKNAIVQRLLSARSGVSSQMMRGGHKIPDQALRDLIFAAEELKHEPIYIDDTPSLTVLNLRARARRMVAQHGVKVIMIDYLQLMSAPGAARESRQVEVSTISRGVKSLARELNIPVVCLSQLNRASESREGNRPRMSDLRESGSIEQDADVIMLLHREEYYHIQDEDWKMENPDKVGLAEVIVAKQRNGPTGVIKLSWDNRTTRFKNYDATAQAPGEIDAAFGGGGGGGSGGYGSPSQAASNSPFAGARRGPAPGAARGWTHETVPQPDIKAKAQPPANPSESPPFDVDPMGDSGAPDGPAFDDRYGGGGQGNASPPPTYRGFSPGKKTGPIENHRDGGGPDVDDDEIPI